MHDCAAVIADLFHGAHPDTIHSICKNGFDCRLSNPGGALGKGTYFADKSSYSNTYCLAPKRDIETAHGRGRGGYPGGATPSFGAFGAAAGAPPASAGGTLKMILARVALGSVTNKVVGGSLPDFLSPGRRADSVTNVVGAATSTAPKNAMFVVYHNDQAYPE